MDEAACRAVSESGERRRLRPTGLLAMAAAGSLLLAACGGSTDASHPSSSAPRTTGTSTISAVSTPHGGRAAAVLAAYRASSAAFAQALATANPADPALATTMVDPQLQSVKANLLADQRQGIVGRGTVTLHPKVVAISGSTATVVDCVYSTSELVYEATGKPVPPVTPPENDGIRATLDLTGGSWKLAKQTVTEGSCVPGS